MDDHSEFLTISGLVFGPKGQRRWPSVVSSRDPPTVLKPPNILGLPSSKA
jgi:hypothetical protein